jgi:phosphoribosyl 1,2-cyclic phosphate phosphodiesterase
MKSNAVLTILGCGTSTGVPLPGCTCEVCSSPSEKNKRDRTSAWLRTDAGYSVLFDAGPDLRQQSLRFKIPRIDAVLFTHPHADHILGVEDLRGFNFVQRESIPCFGTADLIEALQRTFPYIFDPDPNYQGGMLAKLELHELLHYSPLTFAPFEILPFTLMHGSSPITGYRFGNVAYATDCNAIPTESEAHLQGVDYLILDGLRHEPHKTHFSISEAIETAKRLNAKQTYLIHMTHTIDYDTENPKLPEGIDFCYDGLEIPVILDER